MFHGIVIKGDGIGRTLGFPTANLDTPKHQVPLGSGVYAVRAVCSGRDYPAALVIQEEPWKVEVHLMQYSGESCYGLVIEVEPKQKVSEMERFDTMEELKEKIWNDIALVKRVLGI